MRFVDADDNVAVESGNGFKVGEGPVYKLRVGNGVFYNDTTGKITLHCLVISSVGASYRSTNTSVLW